MAKARGKITRTNTPKPGYAKIGEPQFEVAAWCPDDKAEAPPEQVHFIIHWPVGFEEMPPMAIRFKSPDSLGFFIEELARYRELVWPGAAPVDVSGDKDIDANSF